MDHPRDDLGVDPRDLERDDGRPTFSPQEPDLAIPEELRRPVRQPQGDSSVIGPGGSSLTREGAGAVGMGFAVAMNFIACVGAGLGGGWLVDRWRGTAPWGLLIGMGVGFVVGIASIMRQVSRMDRDAKRQ